MQLQELFDYKNQLASDLLGNAKIWHLLTDKDESEYSEDAAAKLMYEQFLPYEYLPDTIEHGQTYIFCDVDIQKSLNKTYLLPVIYIWVLAHKSKLRLPEGGVRTDVVCAEIAKTINGSRFYGLGELELYAVKRFAPLNDYQGKVMTFNAVEINRLNSANKNTPTIRRA